MQITGLEATDIGNDVLLVRATVDELPGVFEARGWVSALTNHHDAPLGKDGHRSSKAQPRPMTEDEKAAYCAQVLAEQNPELRALVGAASAAPVFAHNPEAIADELARLSGADGEGS